MDVENEAFFDESKIRMYQAEIIDINNLSFRIGESMLQNG
jgi:hypothetical protein